MDTITTPSVAQSPPASTIQHTAQVSLTSRYPASVVHLVQYDTDVPIIAVALTANGQPYTVPSGAAVNVRLAKPDGTYVYNPAYGLSEDRQTVYIAVTVQMTVCSGKISPVVEVVVDGGTAATGFFVLDIDPNPIPEDAIASTDEYKTIQQLAAEVTVAAQILTDNLPGIQYIQQNADTITAVAQNSENITAVGENIGNVNSVAQNLTPIQTAAANISAIQAAPTAASDAAASATLSQSWAVGGTGTRPGENTNNAEYWAQQAQAVAQGQLGWFATEQALESAHPTGQNGQWAIIGSTDTIWTWDSDTAAWVDTGDQVDLSDYYTKIQADSAFAPKSHASTLATYGTGSSAYYGHVRLSDTPGTSGVSGGMAATPKCVQDSISANKVSVSFKNGATDYGTHLYRIGNIVIGVIELNAPDIISSAGWVTYMHINTPPVYRVNGRAAFGAAEAVRDYLITAGASGGDFNVYVDSVDAGKIINIPVAYVVKV